jgi:hypothetical protein
LPLLYLQLSIIYNKKLKPMKLFSLMAGGILFVSSINAQISTSIELLPDTGVTPTNSELVTFGLPIKKSLITNTDDIRVSIGAVEQSISIQQGLTWWDDNSIRSVIIQLQGVDMTNGNVTLNITDNGRNTANDLTMQAHHLGWVQAGPDKDNMNYPRIFALHDPVYLAESDLIPPYLAAPIIQDTIEDYKEEQFSDWAESLDYPNTSRGNWLFDRASATAKVYMTTGKVHFLKEAFLSKQFYFKYVRRDGATPSAPGGQGCWTWETTACADGKYIYPQPAKLLLALAGDTSQWNNQLIVDMALQADLGWNQYGTRDPYNTETEGFTERAAGLVGLAELHSYEITGDPTVLAHMNERITNLKDMQQTQKSWDISNGWIPKSGGLTHSWAVHEGSHSQSTAPLGNTNDRGFSPWMSENVADFLWHAYWATGNSDAPEMLRLLGNAVDIHGFTTSYNNSSGLYDVKPAFSSFSIQSNPCITGRRDLDLTYFSSAYAHDSILNSGNWFPWYTSNHDVEVMLILATAYYFENNSSNCTRLKARLDKMRDGLFTKGCAQISNTPRAWNWQHRSNSVRTWDWVVNNKLSTSVPVSNSQEKIAYYPNPVDNKLSINLRNDFDEVNIDIVSIDGKIVLSKKYHHSRNISIELGIPTGFYFVNVSSQKLNTTFKIIKK